MCAIVFRCRTRDYIVAHLSYFVAYCVILVGPKVWCQFLSIQIKGLEAREIVVLARYVLENTSNIALGR